MKDIMWTIRKTTFVIFGGFGFEFYWLNFMVISIWLFVGLCILDTMFGLSIARKMKEVSSKQRDSWIDRKATQLFLILFIAMACGSLAHEIDSPTIEIWLWVIAFFPIVWFSFWQITSIIENMAINAHGKELWFINLLLKLAWIGQAKIEEKLAKYNIKPSIPTDQ